MALAQTPSCTSESHGTGKVRAGHGVRAEPAGRATEPSSNEATPTRSGSPTSVPTATTKESEAEPQQGVDPDSNLPHIIANVQPTTEDSYGCFGAGTPIATPDGDRAIETLRVGDPVLTLDTTTGQLEVAAVLARFKHYTSLGSLPLEDGQELRVTAYHPLILADSRQTAAAGTLDVGAALLKLVDADGACALSARATCLSTVNTPLGQRFVPSGGSSAEPVYDLTTSLHHNYFAGGILVHNKTCQGRPVRVTALDTGGSARGLAEDSGLATDEQQAAPVEVCAFELSGSAEPYDSDQIRVSHPDGGVSVDLLRVGDSMDCEQFPLGWYLDGQLHLWLCPQSCSALRKVGADQTPTVEVGCAGPALPSAL